MSPTVAVIKFLGKLSFLACFWMTVFSSIFKTDYLPSSDFGDVIRELAALCATPFVEDLGRRLATMVIVNVIFSATIRRVKLTPLGYNVLSSALGIAVLFANVGVRTFVLFAVSLFVCWVQMRLAQWVLRRKGHQIPPMYVVSAITVSCMVVGEWKYPNPHEWAKARGILATMAMKLVSVSINDFHLSTFTDTEFFGYMLCPPTVLFGPWITIVQYQEHRNRHQSINWKWFVKVVQILTYAMIFMVISNYLYYSSTLISNCFFKYDESMRYALAFRASKYYLHYMAEWNMILAGFSTIHPNPDGDWEYSVCKPWQVEFPRSIPVAVRNWNIPVYNFLENYFYVRKFEFGRTGAIAITFFVAALLHGLNVRVLYALITLGLVSVSQKVILDKLADHFDACVKVDDCKTDCGHRYGFYHPLSLLINGCNLILNLLHLIYLGDIIDDHYSHISLNELFATWDYDFGFLSNTAVIFMFSTSLLFL